MDYVFINFVNKTKMKFDFSGIGAELTPGAPTGECSFSIWAKIENKKNVSIFLFSAENPEIIKDEISFEWDDLGNLLRVSKKTIGFSPLFTLDYHFGLPVGKLNPSISIFALPVLNPIA